MEAVILAAGMGTRMDSLIPKPLTSVHNEQSILDLQVDKLLRRKEIHNIFMVVGYKKELIMELFPDLLFVYNNGYARTNTAKSLLQALRKIEDDVIWLNGDVYFDSEILSLVLASRQSACLVNVSECNDEAVKYDLSPDGYIRHISKTVASPLGEALGINLIRQKDLELLRTELAAVRDGEYFEKALENLTLKNRLKLLPIDAGPHFCREIDFDEDLRAVQAHYREKYLRK